MMLIEPYSAKAIQVEVLRAFTGVKILWKDFY